MLLDALQLIQSQRSPTIELTARDIVAVRGDTWLVQEEYQ
jgi:hypothetical protein